MNDSTPNPETESLTPPAPDAVFASSPTVPFEPAVLTVSDAPTNVPTPPPGAAGASHGASGRVGPAVPLRPRTRWAAIIWGAVFAAVATVALWTTVSPDRRTALADWSLSLSPAAIGAYVALAIGAIALVAGLVGILRRVQRAVEDRRAVTLSSD